MFEQSSKGQSERHKWQEVRNRWHWRKKNSKKQEKVSGRSKEVGEPISRRGRCCKKKHVFSPLPPFPSPFTHSFPPSTSSQPISSRLILIMASKSQLTASSSNLLWCRWAHGCNVMTLAINTSVSCLLFDHLFVLTACNLSKMQIWCRIIVVSHPRKRQLLEQNLPVKIHCQSRFYKHRPAKIQLLQK